MRLAIWARAVNRNMVVYHFELENFHLRLEPSPWRNWRRKVPVSVFHTRIHQTRRIQKNPLCKSFKKYNRTSRKRPPKMQSLSGRLEEVVAYKNQTTGRLFQEQVRAHLLYEK